MATSAPVHSATVGPIAPPSSVVAHSNTVGPIAAILSSDTTPPTVSLTAPANGASVSGSVTVSASASDNVAVARVEFLVDGVLVGVDTIPG